MGRRSTQHRGFSMYDEDEEDGRGEDRRRSSRGLSKLKGSLRFSPVVFQQLVLAALFLFLFWRAYIVKPNSVPCPVCDDCAELLRTAGMIQGHRTGDGQDAVSFSVGTEPGGGNSTDARAATNISPSATVSIDRTDANGPNTAQAVAVPGQGADPVAPTSSSQLGEPDGINPLTSSPTTADANDRSLPQGSGAIALSFAAVTSQESPQAGSHVHTVETEGRDLQAPSSSLPSPEAAASMPGADAAGTPALGPSSASAPGSVDDDASTAASEEQGQGRATPPPQLNLDSLTFYGQERGGHNQPDRILFETFFQELPLYGRGTFVEVGAHDGLSRSNTLFFEETLSWSGLLIEAATPNFEALKETQLKRRTRSQIVHSAACPSAGTLRFIGDGGTAGAVQRLTSSFSAKWSKYWKEPWNVEYEVPCEPMHALVARAGITQIDLLSIDVEGSEYDFLESFDFDRVFVRVLVFERGMDADRDASASNLLFEKGFCRAFDVSTNQYWVKDPAFAKKVCENLGN